MVFLRAAFIALGFAFLGFATFFFATFFFSAIFAAEIFFSSATLIELMLVADKINFEPLRLVQFALRIGTLKDDDPQPYIVACEYQNKYGLSIFDSIHVAKSNNKIITSDKKIASVPFLEVVRLNN